MDIGDLNKFTDRELLLITAQDVMGIKGEQKTIREEFKSTTKVFRDIVNNCKSSHRQESLEIEKRIKCLETFKDRVHVVAVLISATGTGLLGKILKVI